MNGHLIVRSGRVKLAVVLILALTNAGCFFRDGQESASLRITISSTGKTTSSLEKTQLNVTAENRGGRRAEWGVGSSSCQLESKVRVGGRLYLIAADRPCTDDISAQGLDAGTARTENLPWSGQIWKSGNLVQLEPGSYEVYGAAGDFLSRTSILIDITE